MKQITFYLDFISPFAYLAFDKLPQVFMGHSYSVTYKPILLAALLKHHGQLGPAEIAPKRDWTYRHVQWLAHSQGLELQLPASHPLERWGRRQRCPAPADADAAVGTQASGCQR